MPELKLISDVEDSILDVIFVHGPGGNSTDSWSSEVGYWPQWVSESNPSVSVTAVEYSYGVSFFRRNALSIRDHAIALIELLVSSDKGTRPLVFVAHSLGGVVVKELLRQSSSPNQDYRGIFENTAAVVFLATPTSVAPHFSRNFFFGLLRAPIAGTDLPSLRDANDFYREYAQRNGVTTLSFAAARDVFAQSVDPGVSDAVVIPIDTSHSGIAKPTSRNSLVVVSVQRLFTTIQDLLRENRLKPGFEQR